MAFELASFVSTVFVGSFSVVLTTFGLYSIFLLYYGLKGRSSIKSKKSLAEAFMPSVSIILPTFNEGTFIQRKIENLLDTAYNKNKIEIIVVDDSTDEMSKQIISSLSNKYKNVKKYSSNRRRGYSQALLDGFRRALGDIIIITDCGSIYDPNTIKELVYPYKDPKIGGVTGAANIINQDEQLGKSESFYRKIYNFMRKSESNADSTFHFHGEGSSVRKELLVDLPCFPTNLDIAIAFHIRKQGYKVLFNPEAKFSEFAPNKFEERHKQKSIRAAGLILVIFGYRGMFSPQYGLFGTIIYPAHFSMMILCPISIVSGITSFFLLLGTLPKVGLLILFVILFLVLLILIIKSELITNFFQLEFALLQGIWKAFKERNNVIYIEKIESTRRK